jgi:hypothetical protein
MNTKTTSPITFPPYFQVLAITFHVHTNFGDPNYMIQLHSNERIVAFVAKGGDERKLQMQVGCLTINCTTIEVKGVRV